MKQNKLKVCQTSVDDLVSSMKKALSSFGGDATQTHNFSGVDNRRHCKMGTTFRIKYEDMEITVKATLEITKKVGFVEITCWHKTWQQEAPFHSTEYSAYKISYKVETDDPAKLTQTLSTNLTESFLSSLKKKLDCEKSDPLSAKIKI